jgi:peptidoglycan/xylan/chitin deacetylase (PgdA/CDA1 family)
VLKPGAGQPPFVSADGRPLDAGTTLGGTSELTSHNGSDTVEPTRVSTESIAIPVQYEGVGSIETVVSSGSPGVREITIGTISGQVVRRRITVKPVAKLVEREQPYVGTRTVALTFDDGPWPGSTLAILNILKQNDVQATFFEIGRQARQMPSLSRQVADAGMEMGNHSETHPLSLAHLSAANVANEITRAQSDITKASGKAPTFFRPPGGNTTPAMYPVLTKLNLGWVQWDIDTDDWQRPPPDKIVSRVLRNVRPGSVVLMHDGGGNRSNTVKALPTIIKALKAQGYVFVTIDQLPSVPHRMG